MKIQTLTLIYKLLQDEAAQADREYKEALARQHAIEADGEKLTEMQKRRLEVYRKGAFALADALADFEAQEWCTRAPQQE